MVVKMVLTKKITTSTKKIWIYGSGSLLAFFILLAGLSFYGVSVTTSGDITCLDKCESYFNISLQDYALCFGSTFRGVYLEPEVPIEVYYRETIEENPKTYYCKASNLTEYCFKLSTPSNNISTRCYYNESATTKYKVCNTGWVKQTNYIIKWNPYNFTANTCLDRNKIHEFKLVGYKKPSQTIKWGLDLEGKDVDPFWYGVPDPSTTYYNATPDTFDGFSTITWRAQTFTANSSGVLQLIKLYFSRNLNISASKICYQESANVSNQTGLDNCVETNYTGSYAIDRNFNDNSLVYDGNWSTNASGTIGICKYGILYINYTKPKIVSDTIWAVKDGVSIKNLTIPDDCLNLHSKIIALKVFLVSGSCSPSSQGIYYSCDNGASGFYGDIGTIKILNFTNTPNPTFYEEAIFWDVPANIVVSLRATNGEGEPTGSDLSIGILDGSDINESGEWREITMSSYNLNASTKYAICVRVG